MNVNKLILMLALAASFSVSALTDREQQIVDRLIPVGQTCMAGEACSYGMATTTAGAKDPEQVYNTYCMACHMTGATNAPITGSVDAWAPRIAKGTEVLYKNAINGISLMPAKGLCGDCSDDDVIAAVDYILDKSQ